MASLPLGEREVLKLAAKGLLRAVVNHIAVQKRSLRWTVPVRLYRQGQNRSCSRLETL